MSFSSREKLKGRGVHSGAQGGGEDLHARGCHRLNKGRVEWERGRSRVCSVVMRARSEQEMREERKASQQLPFFLNNGVGRRGRAAWGALNCIPWDCCFLSLVFVDHCQLPGQHQPSFFSSQSIHPTISRRHHV